ncbi:MAG: hypothetical protein FJZ64_03955 [Chlamydiae bacterium]|nr:hypothetical protein [Chlamydiota bacterium]
MKEKETVSVIAESGKPFELLLAATLKGLKTSETYSMQVTYIVSKPELLELIKSFVPQDAIELLLILQFLIGYLWSTEKLARGHSFGDFSNLSLRAADLLIRYKGIKLKKALKKDIPHEEISDA